MLPIILIFLDDTFDLDHDSEGLYILLVIKTMDYYIVKILLLLLSSLCDSSQSLLSENSVYTLY
jgi:hypothetical protein